MKRRQTRYMSVPELLPKLLESSKLFAKRMVGKTHRYQLRALRSMVRGVERRTECSISKRHGGVLYVDVDAIELLAPDGMTTLSMVERNLAELHENHKQLKKRVLSYAVTLREHDSQITKLREKQSETTRYLSRLNAIDQK